MKEMLLRLTAKDNKAAYELAKQIGIESAKSDKYLEMIPTFAKMLQDKSSFVRTRGFILICNQARWANDGQIEAVFEQMEMLLNDNKPTVVRQCLSALHELVLFRPELVKRIAQAVDKIEPERYQDSMSGLIKKDIAALEKLFG